MKVSKKKSNLLYYFTELLPRHNNLPLHPLRILIFLNWDIYKQYFFFQNYFFFAEKSVCVFFFNI